MLAQTSDWQRWENRPRAWRGAAEPSPRTLQGHQPVHGQVGREVFTAPWGYVGWGDHGPLGQAQLQQAVTKKLPPRPHVLAQGAAEEGKGFHWDPWDLGFSPKPSAGNGDNNCVVST